MISPGLRRLAITCYSRFAVSCRCCVGYVIAVLLCLAIAGSIIAIANVKDAQSSGRTILFIDSGIDNFQVLAKGAAPGTETVLLDNRRDGLQQIAEYLKQPRNDNRRISSLQIVSHGEIGHIQIGNTVLSAQNIDRYDSDWKTIRSALTPDSDILLFGCNVAGGKSGIAFIKRIAVLTGANVAASTNLTGNAARGADWTLEATIGRIRSKTALSGRAREEFDGVLQVTFSSGDIALPDQASSQATAAVYKVAPSTGNRTVATGNGVGTGGSTTISLPLGTAISTSGVLYYLDKLSSTPVIVQVDPSTGNRTVITGNGTGSGPAFTTNVTKIVWDPSTGTILVADAGTTSGASSNSAILRVNVSTGARTIVANNSTGSGAILGNAGATSVGLGKLHITVKPDGTIYAFNGTSVYQVDPATGNRTVISDNTGSHGTGTNFISTLNDVAWNPATGLIVFTDVGSSSTTCKVGTIDPSTGNRTTLVLGTGVKPTVDIPRSVAVTSSGTIYVFDSGNGGSGENTVIYSVSSGSVSVVASATAAIIRGTGPFPSSTSQQYQISVFNTATATKLAVTQINGGSNPTVGTSFSVVIQAQDGSGTATNVLSDTTVSLSKASGTGTLGGTLTGTITAGTNSVTISGVTYNKGESGVSITAARTGGDTLTSGTSSTFAVNWQTITVNPSTIAQANVNSPYTQGFTQTGGIGTTNLSESGGLPTGVSFDSGTNQLTGTPTQSGSYPITISATDSNGAPGSSNYTLLSCDFGLTTNSQSFPLSGGNGGITVTPTSGSCTWTASTTDSFITINSGSSGTGTGAVTYSVSSSGADRVGHITIGGQTVTVNQNSTTGVNLSSFSAVNNGGVVSLQWQTGFEVDNLGFNLYRETDGQRVKINPSLIAGSALLAGSNVRVESGNSYSWQDDVTSASASYWLEDVDIDGTSTWHGPFGITQSSTAARRLNRVKSALLNDLNVTRAETTPNSAVLQREYPADFADSAETTAEAQVVRKGRSLAISSQDSETLKKQWAIAAGSAIKIAINQTGWYHLNMTDLMAAGLSPAANPQTLQMYVGGKEIPIKINLANRAMLSGGDSIEFYGSALDTPTTNTQVYWLVSGSQTGKRIGIAQSPATSAVNNQSSFQYTVESRERSIYFSSLRNGDAENWFGKVINASPASEVITIHDKDVTSNGQAQIEFALQGVTAGQHQVLVMLNGQPISTVNFNGTDHQVTKISLPESSLEEGDNNVTFTAQNSSDVSLFDYIKVTYAHTYSAVNNNLFTSVPGMTPVTIGGFTSNRIRVIDVAIPSQPVEIEGTITGGKGNYSIGLGPAKQRDLLMFTPDQMLQPASITANQPSTLNKDNNRANFVVITYKDFTQNIQPFVALKQSQGYKVAVVDVENIYDEFSYGVHTPQALKDFLGGTYTHWSTQPQFVMLAGSASLDPKNYTGAGYQDFIPTKLIDTASMETASDDWLVDFNNDGQPQISIGRLPVRTASEMATVISKIVNYEQTGVAQSVLLVSDLSDGVDFNSATSQIKATIPAGFNTVSIVRGQTTTDAKTELMAQLAQGGKIVNYSGHGSVSLWRGNLLTSADVQTLTNQKALPLVVMMTCLNAYFQDPQATSLGESLIKVNQGGAVSVWASSAMTNNGAQTIMDRELFRQLFGNPNITLGQAIREAKKITTDSDIRRTWILFGDPTMTIKIQR